MASINWTAAVRDLDSHGHTLLPKIWTAAVCATARSWYEDDSRFRSRVVMARHGFGQGEYKYFDYPLPPAVEKLRTALYPRLAAIANRWATPTGGASRLPPTHEEYLARCHAAGQTRATPLMLRYETGDFNCLHQDLYGDLVFPLQVTILLSSPGTDFTGGEFVLVEGRPRQQSQADVVPLTQGDAVVFPVRHRPVRGRRGTFRATMKHGVARVRSGLRLTLGIIFHDAQ